MKYLVFIMIFCVSANSWATNRSGTIVKMSVGRNGDQVFIDLNTSGENACLEAHPSGFDYALSISGNEAGPEILTSLMLAYSLGKSVTIIGTNTCLIEGRLEDTSYIILL